MSDIQTFQQKIGTLSLPIATVLGCINGMKHYKKFGYVGSLSALGDVWPNGGSYVFPVAGGQELQAVSTNAADTSSFHIQGLDGSTGLEKEEIFELTGTTPKTVPGGLWSAVNRVHTDGEAAILGNVSIQGTGTPNSNVFAVVLASDQQTTQCPYKVPSNYVAIISNISAALNASGGGSDSAIIRISVRADNKTARTQVRFGVQKQGDSVITTDIIEPVLIPPSAEIRLTADPSATIDISGAYSMYLIEKQLIPPATLQAITDE